MDRALKQRLLGAVILTALLVILVPEWLDGAGHKSRYPSQIEMPVIPQFTPMRELTEKAADAPEPKAIQPTPEPAAAPVAKPTTQSSIHAWALQVGSFSEQSNARVMRDRMRAKGYAAYIHQQTSAGKIQYRVRIGPELDRARVDKLKKQVQDREKIKGMVVKHP